MSNTVMRGLVMVGAVAAAMISASGCADLSDLYDPIPGEGDEGPRYTPPPIPELEGESPYLPTLTGVELPSTTADKPQTSPERQVLQVAKGGALVVKRDEQLAQSLSGDTTVELWVWFETMEDQPLVRMGDVSLAIRASRVWAQLDGAEVESDKVVPQEWYHVALVTQDDQVRLYVNGHMSGATQAPAQWQLDEETITIGGRQDDVGAFTGKLDNIRVTSQALYNAEDFSPSQQLVVLDSMAFAYDFDQQDGAQVEDLSVNERHGTIVGEAAMIGGSI